MHQLGFVLFTYLAAVLHVGAGSESLAGVGIEPHFLLLVVITAVLYFENWTALVWAAVAGLVSDGLSAGPLGVEMACFTAAAFFLQHRLRRQASPGIVRLTLLDVCDGLGRARRVQHRSFVDDRPAVRSCPARAAHHLHGGDDRVGRRRISFAASDGP